MPTQKTKSKKSRSHRQTRTVAVRAIDPPVKVAVPKPVTEIVTEKTYVTTEPQVEIRKPATLAQALTEPAVAVVKPKFKVRKKVVARSRRIA
jgi:hypothetical protein